jgi:hypothetical protein
MRNPYWTSVLLLGAQLAVTACVESEPTLSTQTDLLQPSCSFDVTQGGSTFAIGAVLDATNVQAFYGWDTAYPQSANTGFEVPDRTALLVHQDQTSGSASLVLIHDAPSSDTGGQTFFEISGLPSAAQLTVLDDPDDNYLVQDGLLTAVWDWDEFTTDGAAITFPDGNICVDVHPRFALDLAGYAVIDGTTGAVTELPFSPTPLRVCATPPTVTTKSALTMWAPNHQLTNFSIGSCIERAVDNCGNDVSATAVITRVTSDESADGQGDGDRCGDIVLLDDTTVALRAERQAIGDGRVYTVFFTVTDSFGAQTAASCQVLVPLNMGTHTAVIDDTCAACEGTGCGSCPSAATSCVGDP